MPCAPGLFGSVDWQLPEGAFAHGVAGHAGWHCALYSATARTNSADAWPVTLIGQHTSSTAWSHWIDLQIGQHVRASTRRFARCVARSPHEGPLSSAPASTLAASALTLASDESGATIFPEHAASASARVGAKYRDAVRGRIVIEATPCSWLVSCNSRGARTCKRGVSKQGV